MNLVGRNEADASCEKLLGKAAPTNHPLLPSRPLPGLWWYQPIETNFGNHGGYLAVTKSFPFPNITNQSRRTTNMMLDSPTVLSVFSFKVRRPSLTNYLLTPWSRVLFESLTCFQPFKKFPEFHGTRRFITALTSARQLSLSWTSSIQSIPPHPTSWWCVLILSSHLHLGLPSLLWPLHTQTCHMCPSTSSGEYSSYRCQYVSCVSSGIWLLSWLSLQYKTFFHSHQNQPMNTDVGYGLD